MSIAQGDTLNIASSDSSIICKKRRRSSNADVGLGQTAGLLDRRPPGLVKVTPCPPSIIAQSVAFSFLLFSRYPRHLSSIRFTMPEQREQRNEGEPGVRMTLFTGVLSF